MATCEFPRDFARALELALYRTYAVRRINQMHHGYEISGDGMRYGLCTFVVMPKRWLDA